MVPPSQDQPDDLIGATHVHADDEANALPSEDALLIPVSALRHYRFCPRRCALQYVEEQFVDNAYTLEGDALHEHVDDPGVEERAGVRVERALPLYSDRLGLTGKADVIEFHHQPHGGEIPFPVEYKRGARQKYDQTDIQLCAQAMCLEEMLGAQVPAGAIYFGGARRRRDVEFSAPLRSLVEETVRDVRELIQRGVTPPARLGPWCDGCSLREICMPEVTGGQEDSRAYIAEILRTAGRDEP